MDLASVDYYAILNLPRDSSQEEITKSYRILALKYHPDRNKDPSAVEKFIAITEAYEALCMKKRLNEQLYVPDLSIRPGKVDITTQYGDSFAEVSQGDALFFGTLVVSQERKFSAIFNDGYGHYKKWINGKILLVQSDTLLLIKEFERIFNVAISDTGRIAVIHTINRDYSRISSSPKEFIDLGCKLSVFENSGKEIFLQEFGSNVEPCVISPDGRLVLVATAMPDNSVYCFEPERNRLLWKYKNHNKMGVVLGLKFKDTEIEVFVGNSISTMEKDYALNLDGTLTQKYETEVLALSKIKKLPTKERVDPLLEMISSNDRRQIISGLFELKSLVTTKGSLARYSKIAQTVGKLMKDDELFYSIWEVIRKMLKKDSTPIAPLVPNIISWFKDKHETHHVTAFLAALGELGKANPVWIKEEISYIKGKLRSKEWNERRYAALALGSVGSIEPSFVKDVIPVLIEYASDPELTRKELEDMNKGNSATNKFASNSFLNIEITLSSSVDSIGPTWIQDACIDAIGMIGSKSPESVFGAVAMLEELSKNAASPYTVKKALRALDLLHITNSK